MDLSNFLKRKFDGDVELVASDGEVFKVHWVMLTSRLMFFNNMWKSGMKETKEGKVSIDEEGRVVEFVLRWVYKEKQSDHVETDVIKGVLRLADYWDEKKLSDAALSAAAEFVPLVTLTVLGWAIRFNNVEGMLNSVAQMTGGKYFPSPSLIERHLKEEGVPEEGIWGVKVVCLVLSGKTNVEECEDDYEQHKQNDEKQNGPEDDDGYEEHEEEDEKENGPEDDDADEEHKEEDEKENGGKATLKTNSLLSPEFDIQQHANLHLIASDGQRFAICRELLDAECTIRKLVDQECAASGGVDDSSSAESLPAVSFKRLQRIGSQEVKVNVSSATLTNFVGILHGQKDVLGRKWTWREFQDVFDAAFDLKCHRMVKFLERNVEKFVNETHFLIGLLSWTSRVPTPQLYAVVIFALRRRFANGSAKCGAVKDGGKLAASTKFAVTRLAVALLGREHTGSVTLDLETAVRQSFEVKYMSDGKWTNCSLW